MANQRVLPKTVKGWVDLLDRAPIPVAASELKAAREIVASDRLSLRDIAERLQQFPPMVLQVMRAANRGRAVDNRAESLEVAINRLGLGKVEQLIKAMPSKEPEQLPRGLRQTLIISQHASTQANGLFAQRLARLWTEIHWGSLLFLAPCWALCSVAPELYEQWEKRVLRQGESEAKVEKELLGIRLTEMAAKLSEHWGLPEWIARSYELLGQERRFLVKALHVARTCETPQQQLQKLDAEQELAIWLTQPANTVLLANALAVAAHNRWGSVHTLRWQQLTALYLREPLGQVQGLIHQLAAKSARQLPSSAHWHPAQALLWPWDEVRFKPEPKTELKPEPKAEAKPAAARPADPARENAEKAAARAQLAKQLPQWKTLIAQLQQSPSPFNSVLQLTQCARDTAVTCGMQRVLLLLPNRERSFMVAQQSHGFAQPLSNLKLEIQPSPLLRKLMAEPALLHIDSSNYNRYSAHIPGQLKPLFDGQHLLLRSLSQGEKVVMLLIADAGGNAIDDMQVQAFTRTAQALEKGLQIYTKRGRAQA
ncbi:HDOD domain-containing protein [Atopomonas sediminilitoris]|uniref:HDOD domain-containing protein n=1 Tax=Atopomonas sediminilitoris TaxID=2919919 RepID=UPI001F4EA773|nr:HDOD domain-containing protein [Atopomonas sediminilitoris]MCJ8170258.1 HDOD domain-containing protein [Atopomonas sediminilitoris]